MNTDKVIRFGSKAVLLSTLCYVWGNELTEQGRLKAAVLMVSAIGISAIADYCKKKSINS